MIYRKASQSARYLKALGLAIACVLVIHSLASYTTLHYTEGELLMMHSLLEFVTIFVSFTIFSVVWLIRDGLDEDRSRFILFLGINFLSVGVFDILHTLTFEGMPAIVGESCGQKAALFWLFPRYWLALSLLAAFFLNGLLKTSRRATTLYLGINLAAIAAGIIAGLNYPHSLPLLHISGQGPTELKNYLEYILLFLHVVILLITWQKSSGIMENVYLNLSYFGVMSIMAEATLALYGQAHAIYNLAGHVFKAAAFCFLFRAVYWSGVINHFYTLGEMAKMHAELLKEEISLEPIIDIQMNKLRKMLPNADRIAVYTRKQDNYAQVVYVWGKYSNVLIADWQFDLKTVIEKIGECITLINQPMQILELYQTEAKDSQIPVEIPIILSKAKQIMCIPLVAGGQYYGIIYLTIFRRFRRFTANDVEKAKTFQQFSTLIFAQANSQATITRLSFEDSLTGLPNRRFYYSELETIKAAADQRNAPFTVVYLDMNGLKFVNDTLGHAAGDQALKLIGKQLRQRISRPAFAARLGGDEFAAVFPDLGPAEAELAVAKLKEAFADISLDGYNISFALAVGSACYPAEASDLDTLAKLADDRMYEHKRQLKAQAASRQQ